VVAVPVEGFERLHEHTDLPPDVDITVLGDGRVLVAPDALADSGSVAAPIDDARHFRLALDPGEYALCLASGDIGPGNCVIDEVEVPQRIGLERVTDLLSTSAARDRWPPPPGTNPGVSMPCRQPASRGAHRSRSRT